jgi:site-specific DNA recombinase
MKILGYVRVSSKKQVDEGNSLNNQIDNIRKYSDLMKYDLQDILIDDGFSGLSMKRNGLNQLLERLKKDRFDGIVVYSLSRLGRRMKDVITLIDYFNKNNIRFISLKENFDNNGIMGKLILNIMSSVNEFEVNQLGERISDVKKFKKSNKEVFGGILMYGVNQRKGKLIKNKNEYDIIKVIEELRDLGFSYFRIANYLNDEGIKSKLKKRWYGSSVRMVLKNGVNEMYV